MIKENKEKQQDKIDNSNKVKTDILSAQTSQVIERNIKEECNTELTRSESDDGENHKKSGFRVSGSSTPVCTNICARNELQSDVITAGKVNNTLSSKASSSGELCLPDASIEGIKSDAPLQPSTLSCPVKTETNGNNKHEFANNVGSTLPGDTCDVLGVPVPSTTGPPPNGVQPLPSNVINKQPGTMEAQYMQQQSQIFVFSTNLANKSAEAVLQGQYPSIIAYHCAQPGTKKYLEKHPLKMNQFNRQNPAQWLNSLALMKQKSGTGISKPFSAGFQCSNILGEMGSNPGEENGLNTWNQAKNDLNNTSTCTNSSNNNDASCNNTTLNNINPSASCGNSLMQSCSSNIIPGCSSALTETIKSSGIDSQCVISASPNTTSIIPALRTLSPSVSTSNTPLISGAPDIAGSPVLNPSNVTQPTLTGVKVPDENLTPQQRQHREEQLATLRKMQQMLFPEHQSLTEAGTVCQSPEVLSMHGMASVTNVTRASSSGSASGSLPGSTVAGTTSGSGSCLGLVTKCGIGLGGIPGSTLESGSGCGCGPGAVTMSGPCSVSASAHTQNPISGTVTIPTTSSLGNGNGSNSSILAQKSLLAGVNSNCLAPTSAAAQIEWQKLQHQFYEERKKTNVVVGTGVESPIGPSTPATTEIGCTGNRTPIHSIGNHCSPIMLNKQGPPRLQGPPPPYHQTARSASVPIALSSSNPTSPTNPTSNLSLPSPRTNSGLNSPSDSNRSQFAIGSVNGNPNCVLSSGSSPTGVPSSSLDSPTASRPIHPSNPSTPVSTHLSPSAVRKDNLQSGTDFPAVNSSAGSQSANTVVSSHQPAVDNMFCRTLQSLAQQKQQQINTATKEPNLMPVPSPQQIQYLNTFEGQELTIQKQPNTSLKETNVQSPAVTPSSNDGPSSGTELSNSRLSGPATPLTPSTVEFSSRHPPSNAENNRFPLLSPHTPGSDRSQPSQSQTQPSVQQPQTSAQQTPLQSSQQQQQSQQPLTPQPRDRFAGPSPQSQGSCTPGIESSIKTPTSEVNSRFLTSSPQFTDNCSQNRFPNLDGHTSGTSPGVGNQNQNFLLPTPSVSHIKVFLDESPSNSAVAAVDTSPTSSENYSCLLSENVPLNPNSNRGVPCGGKIVHFDPITSMAQMSQQLTSNVANSSGSQSSNLINCVPSGSCTSGMMSLQGTGIHSLEINDGGNCLGLPDSHTSGGNISSLEGGPGNPNGPGIFVNSQMQSVPPRSYSPNSSVTNMAHCSGTVNTTSCMNQPIAHPNASSSPKPGNNMGVGGSHRGSSFYALNAVSQRIVGRPGLNPYNGTNVQVKPNAPNTIQYLPAKSQPGNSGPRGPLSLDFLQRFANPLSNLDSKIPTHNLQYFPNNGLASNSGNPNRPNVSINRPNGLINNTNSPIGLSGPPCGTNLIGGHVGNPISNLNSAIMSPKSSIVGMNLPVGGNLVVGTAGPSVVPLRGGIRPTGVIRMQQPPNTMFCVPGGSGLPVPSDQIFGGPPQNTGSGPNSQVFVPGTKSSPLSLGNTPDASQPLPPSMGQSNNFKNPPFIATSDPNYAQQFHNFQQQLYATNTRSQLNNQGVVQNQSFFVPK